MASATAMNTWLEALAQSFTPPTTKSTDVRKHKDSFVRSVKHHACARTDQFAVTERLVGLEEKLQVLGLDDVAGELFSRRAELQKDHDDVKWLPDVLDLLLHLSNEPVKHSRIENLERHKPRAETPLQLRWEDIEAEDPIDRRDPIWSVPQYFDFSSDEDEEIATSSTQTSPASVKQQYTTKVDAERIFDSPTTDVAATLKAAQFWQSADRIATVTETQAVREVLFALGGLPTSMFTSFEHGIKPNPRFRIRHLQATTSLSLLKDVANLASEVNTVRQWLRLRQSSSVMQLVNSEIREVLGEFDRAVSQEHAAILHQNSPTGVVSLLQVLQSASTASLPLQCIRTITAQSTSNEPVAVLDAMYNTLEIAQASCNTVDVDTILPIFLSALTLYAKAVDEWLHAGTIDATESFFITENDPKSRNPGTLWHDWFVPFSGEDDLLPAFLEQCSARIFTIGKTAAFLTRLGSAIDDYTAFDLGIASAALEAAGLIAGSPLPFSATFEMVLERHLTTLLKISTSALKHVLEANCGLTRLLNAFDYLYLAKDGVILATIETKMFDQIDRCVELWNDRFLLSDSLAEVYTDIASVDPEAISVQALHTSSRTMENRRRSVKILTAVSLSYHISWPLANIILPSSMTSYQRIALMLSQIRRAKYLLDRRAHFFIQHMPSLPSADASDLNPTRLLFWQLSFSVNVLYAHFTSCVVQPLTRTMREQLASPATASLDAMIAIHNQYIVAMEHACLCSKRIKPLRDALVSILDLCVRLTDLVTAYSGITEKARGLDRHAAGSDDGDGDFEANSFISARSRRRRYRRKRAADDDDSSSEEYEDRGNDETGWGEGYSTFILDDTASASSSLDHEINKIRVDFKKHVDFLVAGLKAVARNSSSSSSLALRTGGGGLGEDFFEVGEMFELLAGGLEGVFPVKRRGFD